MVPCTVVWLEQRKKVEDRAPKGTKRSASGAQGLLESLAEEPVFRFESNGSVGACAETCEVDGVGSCGLHRHGPSHVLSEGSEKGGLQVEQDDGGEEGPDWCRKCKVSRERW